MSDEQHDYSEIYTPTGNDDRLRHPPGVATTAWNHNEDQANMVHVAINGAGTGTTTTNTSCRYMNTLDNSSYDQTASLAKITYHFFSNSKNCVSAIHQCLPTVRLVRELVQVIPV